MNIEITSFFDFLQDAGKYALDMQKNIDFLDSQQKSEKISDVVTEIDFNIGKKFSDYCKNHFSNLDYIIVNEESISELGDNPKSTILEHEYAFIIDPIDGTFPYRNKLPMWAISVAIWHKESPLYGAVYVPSMQILEYNDDMYSYLIEGVFTSQEWKKQIYTLLDSEESSQMFIMTSNSILMSRDWRNYKIPRMSFNCAVISSMMVISGKSIGFIGRDYLWDFGAIIPIASKVGVNLYNFKTMQKFQFDMLNDKLQMSNYELVCRPKYLKFIKENTEYKDIK
jgi:myo-inositol-1(or 4)-monophosphatase